MLKIREINKEDNPAIASVVRQVMTEYGADPKTTILGDPVLHTMFENYQKTRAAYFVAELDGKIVGGAGVTQLNGSKENVCELQRMFLLPEARGKKIGKQLLDLCIAKAKEFNYDSIYLESLNQMKDAKKLYDKSGFKEVSQPMGATGHGGCDVWMVLNLNRQKKKVMGIGGIFFKCKDPEAMKSWYNKNLGLITNEYGSLFEFRSSTEPEKKEYLQWSPFPEATKYFEPSKKQFMINYRVEKLAELVEELKFQGVNVLDDIEGFEYGKFVHIMDPEGNKIELWEPVDEVFTESNDKTTC